MGKTLFISLKEKGQLLTKMVACVGALLFAMILIPTFALATSEGTAEDTVQAVIDQEIALEGQEAEEIGMFVPTTEEEQELTPSLTEEQVLPEGEVTQQDAQAVIAEPVNNGATLYYGVVDTTLYISNVVTEQAQTDGSKALNSTSSSTVPWYSKAGNLTYVIITTDGNNIAPTGMAFWFYNMAKVTHIDGLNNIDTSKVTTFSSLFNGDKLLESVNLTNFDTSSATTMRYMFGSCYKLASIGVSNFDTSNVTDMAYMFYGCMGLEGINLKDFDTSKVTTMENMFEGCVTLQYLNLSSFDTSQVTTMKRMFFACNNIEVLNIDGWNTEKVTNMSYMFDGMWYVEDINTAVLNTSNVTTMSYMFGNCVSIEEFDLSNFDTSKVEDFSFMFTTCIGLESFTYNGGDTSNLKNMLCMFSACENLEYVDLSAMNTSSVTNMNRIFDTCTMLKEVNLSTWDTSNVTGMTGLFEHCGNLESVDLSNFNTEKVENMAHMFWQCYALTELDLSYFNTSALWNMAGMFEECYNLQVVDLANFSINLDRNTSMEDTFLGCESLETIYAGDNFIVTPLTYDSDMFYGCENLVGGEGTMYDEAHVDQEYAHVDGGVTNPGYLTKRVIVEVSIITPDEEQGYIVDEFGNAVTSLNLVLGSSLVVNEDDSLSIIPPEKVTKLLLGSTFDTITLYAIPNEGYEFVAWNLNEYTVTENTKIGVTFAKTPSAPVEEVSATAQTGDSAAILYVVIALIAMAGTCGAFATRKYLIKK